MPVVQVVRRSVGQHQNCIPVISGHRRMFWCGSDDFQFTRRFRVTTTSGMIIYLCSVENGGPVGCLFKNQTQFKSNLLGDRFSFLRLFSVPRLAQFAKLHITFWLVQRHIYQRKRQITTVMNGLTSFVLQRINASLAKIHVFSLVHSI